MSLDSARVYSRFFGRIQKPLTVFPPECWMPGVTILILTPILAGAARAKHFSSTALLHSYTGHVVSGGA